MMDSLSSGLARLRLDADGLDADAFETRLAEETAGFGATTKPRKRARRDPEDLKAELERDFLTPSPRVSPEWLNRLQK